MGGGGGGGGGGELINGILRYFLTNLPLSCIPRWLPDFIMETAIFNASHFLCSTNPS